MDRCGFLTVPDGPGPKTSRASSGGRGPFPFQVGLHPRLAGRHGMADKSWWEASSRAGPERQQEAGRRRRQHRPYVGFTISESVEAVKHCLDLVGRHKAAACTLVFLLAAVALIQYYNEMKKERNQPIIYMHYQNAVEYVLSSPPRRRFRRGNKAEPVYRAGQKTRNPPADDSEATKQNR
jgi:hypothetical protein